MLPLDVCGPCLRRTHLLGLVATRIERAGRGRAAFGGLLALEDEDLVAALGARNDRAIHLAREAFEPDSACDAIIAAGLGAVCRHGSWYPTPLLDLEDAPVVLHVAGDPGLLADLSVDDGRLTAVAVVGARRATPYGLDVARVLGRGLAAAGITVISGMALGIDSAAHAGALEAPGPTIAVLAGGADRPYPASKRALYRRIVEHGCVVSEMPPGFTPFRWSFPARNRTIAALGQMTVVVEAAERSGSLITAEVASDLGRDVGALPGAVTSWRSKGTNALLHDGAALVRDAGDVLDAVLGLDRHVETDVGAGLEPRLGSLLRAVTGGRDTLAALSGAPDQAQATLAALTELELLGRLRRVAGGRYVVVPRW